MDEEDELVPISALQHFLFCEWQCALIHIEQVWADNLFTSEGNLLHERTHEGPDESRPGVHALHHNRFVIGFDWAPSGWRWFAVSAGAI